MQIKQNRKYASMLYIMISIWIFEAPIDKHSQRISLGGCFTFNKSLAGA